jgi:hypothetical protein
MKTKNELKSIVNLWWEYNQTLAQMPEGKYFEEQIGDWESGFRNYTKDGYQAPTGSFTIERIKDIKGGLSMKLVGSETLDGILNVTTGEFVEKEIEGNTTGSFIIRGASIDG